MEEQRARQIYIWIISICGFILAFLTPPLAAPDEQTHFLNAYCYSQLDFWSDIDESMSTVGKYIPKYIDVFVQKYEKNYAMNWEDGYSFFEGYLDSWIAVNDADRELVFWESTDINPLAYFISSLGMRIVSIFCHLCGGGFDTAYNLMLAGRLANVFFYVLVVYWAISITPCLRRTMMLLAGMPMSIFLGASLSYDAILIPVAMLFFAEFMKLYIGTETALVDCRDMVTVGICVLFLVAVKKVCAPFICLLVLIPRSKFKSEKQYLVSIGMVFTVGIMALLPDIIAGVISRGVSVATNPNILAQKEYLYHNLNLIPKIIGKTFIDYSNFYLSGFVGKLGQLDTNFPILYIGIFWVILLIVAFAEGSKVKGVNWKLRVATMVVSTIIVVEMFVKMYISWTPRVEEPFGSTVSGVQGRYFIPMFCFWLIIMFNNLGSRLPVRVLEKGSKVINNIVMFSVIMSCILTVLIILLRYWCF